MRISKVLASGLVATSLISAPIAVQAATAEAGRIGAGIEGEQQAGGFPFLIVLVVIAVGLGIYFAVDDDGDDLPTSP